MLPGLSRSLPAMYYCERKQRGLGTRLLSDQAELSSLAEALRLLYS